MNMQLVYGFQKWDEMNAIVLFNPRRALPALTAAADTQGTMYPQSEPSACLEYFIVPDCHPYTLLYLIITYTLPYTLFYLDFIVTPLYLQHLDFTWVYQVHCTSVPGTAWFATAPWYCYTISLGAPVLLPEYMAVPYYGTVGTIYTWLLLVAPYCTCLYLKKESTWLIAHHPAPYAGPKPPVPIKPSPGASVKPQNRAGHCKPSCCWTDASTVLDSYTHTWDALCAASIYEMHPKVQEFTIRSWVQS